MKKSLPIILILILAALLRLVALDKFPSGLNADEAAIGYNAYSLLETGRDEHGVSWPLVFRSFDDYKPPLYFYLVLPFVKVFGLSVWAVRLPNAIAGILSVYFIYLLTNKLFPKNPSLGSVAAMLLAISPWHLQFSRGGWEVNVSTLFLLMGTYFLFRTLDNMKYFYLSALLFIAAIYTYHSARIIVPLLFLSFTLHYFRSIKLKAGALHILLVGIISLILLTPVGFQMLSKEGQSRFSGVSIFADSGPLSWVHEMRRIDPHPNSLITKIKYNRYSAYAGKYFTNYLSHFSARFLFVSGDTIDRSRVPGFGQSFIILTPFLLLGLYLLFKSNSTISRFLLTWFLITPLAAALTFQSPHALRAENMVIPLCLITALGISFCLKYRYILIILSLGLSFQFSQYLSSYYYRYPRELPVSWEYGFDQIASYLSVNQTKYDKIIISDRYDQPYILMAFFLRYPPRLLQKELVMTPRDNFGFSTVRQFGKYEFKQIDYDKDKYLPGTLLVAADEYLPPEKVIYTINSPALSSVFRFASTQTNSVP